MVLVLAPPTIIAPTGRCLWSAPPSISCRRLYQSVNGKPFLGAGGRMKGAQGRWSAVQKKCGAVLAYGIFRHCAALHSSYMWSGHALTHPAGHCLPHARHGFKPSPLAVSLSHPRPSDFHDYLREAVERCRDHGAARFAGDLHVHNPG